MSSSKSSRRGGGEGGGAAGRLSIGEVRGSTTGDLGAGRGGCGIDRGGEGEGAGGGSVAFGMADGGLGADGGGAGDIRPNPAGGSASPSSAAVVCPSSTRPNVLGAGRVNISPRRTYAASELVREARFSRFGSLSSALRISKMCAGAPLSMMNSLVSATMLPGLRTVGLAAVSSALNSFNTSWRAWTYTRAVRRRSSSA
jgi:hypothetical protein